MNINQSIVRFLLPPKLKYLRGYGLFASILSVSEVHELHRLYEKYLKLRTVEFGLSDYNDDLFLPESSNINLLITTMVKLEHQKYVIYIIQTILSSWCAQNTVNIKGTSMVLHKFVLTDTSPAQNLKRLQNIVINTIKNFV